MPLAQFWAGLKFQFVRSQIRLAAETSVFAINICAIIRIYTFISRGRAAVNRLIAAVWRYKAWIVQDVNRSRGNSARSAQFTSFPHSSLPHSNAFKVALLVSTLIPI